MKDNKHLELKRGGGKKEKVTFLNVLRCVGVDDCYPFKRNLGTEEDSQEKLEAEIGAMLTQTKEDVGLPLAGKGRKDHP